MRARLALAGAVVVLGVAFCFVMYWWQLRYPYAAHGYGIAFFATLPFLGLAVMVLGGMSRLGTSLGFTLLAFLTGSAYIGAATSSNSTAGLIWIAPLLYGTIALSIIFALDSIVRGSKLSLRAWREWRRDERRL